MCVFKCLFFFGEGVQIGLIQAKLILDLVLLGINCWGWGKYKQMWAKIRGVHFLRKVMLLNFHLFICVFRYKSWIDIDLSYRQLKQRSKDHQFWEVMEFTQLNPVPHIRILHI